MGDLAHEGSERDLPFQENFPEVPEVDEKRMDLPVYTWGSQSACQQRIRNPVFEPTLAEHMAQAALIPVKSQGIADDRRAISCPDGPQKPSQVFRRGQILVERLLLAKTSSVERQCITSILESPGIPFVDTAQFNLAGDMCRFIETDDSVSDGEHGIRCGGHLPHPL